MGHERFCGCCALLKVHKLPGAMCGLGSLFELRCGGCALGARLAHLFVRAVGNSHLLGMNVIVQTMLWLAIGSPHARVLHELAIGHLMIAAHFV